MSRKETVIFCLLGFLITVPLGCSQHKEGPVKQLGSAKPNYHQEATDDLNRGNFAEAVQKSSDWLRQEPNNPEAFICRGAAYFNLQEYQKAITDQTEAIKLNPNDVRPWSNRGSAYERLDDLDKAIADDTEAIRLDPKCVPALINRGFALLRKGDFDEAIPDLSRAIDLAPLWGPDYAVQACNDRGICYMNNGEIEKAMVDFNRAIALGPESALSYSNRGWLFLHVGEPQKALVDFEKALELDPKLAVAHSNLAWMLATCAHAKLRNQNRALEHALLACNLTKWQEPGCIASLAAAYAEKSDFQKAVKYQEEALQKTKVSKYTKEKEKRATCLEFYKQGKKYREKYVGPKIQLPEGHK